jgi:hypothetical protein
VRTRALLDRISKKQDGTAAAANTANRNRAVLNNMLQCAAEIGIGTLPANPLRPVRWTGPRTLKTVDPRAVVNIDQAQRLLAAVARRGPRGQRVAAFFGCMCYAALRPEEAVDLRRDDLISLSEHGWGEMILTNSEPRSGTRCPWLGRLVLAERHAMHGTEGCRRPRTRSGRAGGRVPETRRRVRQGDR